MAHFASRLRKLEVDSLKESGKLAPMTDECDYGRINKILSSAILAYEGWAPSEEELTLMVE